MSQHHNKNHTREEISVVLQEIQECVDRGRYSMFNLDDEEKQLDLYTKFNILDLPTGSRVVVISFHERNKSIDYVFR